MVKSAYDIMNLLKSELEDEDIETVNDISDAEYIVTEIDDDLEEIYKELVDMHERFTDDQLTIGDVNEFFDTEIRNITDVLKGIRERLY